MIFYRLAAILFDAVRRVRQSESRQCPLAVKFYLGTWASGSQPDPSIEICFETSYTCYEATAVIDDHPSLNTASTTGACQSIMGVGCRVSASVKPLQGLERQISI